MRADTAAYETLICGWVWMDMLIAVAGVGLVVLEESSSAMNVRWVGR